MEEAEIEFALPEKKICLIEPKIVESLIKQFEISVTSSNSRECVDILLYTMLDIYWYELKNILELIQRFDASQYLLFRTSVSPRQVAKIYVLVGKNVFVNDIFADISSLFSKRELMLHFLELGYEYLHNVGCEDSVPLQHFIFDFTMDLKGDDVKRETIDCMVKLYEDTAVNRTRLLNDINRLLVSRTVDTYQVPIETEHYIFKALFAEGFSNSNPLLRACNVDRRDQFVSERVYSYVSEYAYMFIPLKSWMGVIVNKASKHVYSPTTHYPYNVRSLQDEVTYYRSKPKFETIYRTIVNSHLSLLSEISEFMLTHTKESCILFDTVMLESSSIQNVNRIQPMFSNDNGLVAYLNCLYSLKPELVVAWIAEHSAFMNNLVFCLAKKKHTHTLDMKSHELNLWSSTSSMLMATHHAFYKADEELDDVDDGGFSLLELDDVPTHHILQHSIYNILNDESVVYTGNFRFEVTFADEIGSGDGVMRVWFQRVIKELFDPELKLFYREESGVYNLNDPDSINFDSLDCTREELFQFLALFLGFIVRFQIETGKRIASHIIQNSFFVSKKPTLDTYLAIATELDLDFTTNLLKVRDMSWDRFQELFPGQNLDPFMIDSIKERFKLGQFEIVCGQLSFAREAFWKDDNTWTNYVTVRHLQQLICGQETAIDVEDWLEHISWRTTDNPALKTNFIRWLNEASDDDRKKMYQLVTARNFVPLQGFSALDPPFLVELSNAEGYPIARTCFNKLEIPMHLTEYSVFEEKLKEFIAIPLSDSFTLV